MHPRARAVLAALTTAVVLGGTAAGCGSGEPPRRSRAAMVREAEAICAAGLRESDRLRAEAQPGARGEAAATEIDATLEVLHRQIEGFADLRGPASTDNDLALAVRRLRVAAEGLESLRAAAVDEDLTVDEAIRANPDVVQRVNRASAEAADALTRLGFYSCVGLGSE